MQVSSSSSSSSSVQYTIKRIANKIPARCSLDYIVSANHLRFFTVQKTVQHRREPVDNQQSKWEKYQIIRVTVDDLHEALVLLRED